MQLRDFRRRPIVRDVGLGLLLLATSALTPGLVPDSLMQQKVITVLGSEAVWNRLLVLWWLGIAASVAALAISRRRPLAAFALAGAAAVVHRINPGLPVPPTDLAAVICLYHLASLAPQRRTATAALAAALAILPIAALAALAAPGWWTVTDTDTDNAAAPTWDSGTLASAVTGAVVPALLLGIAYAAGDNTRTRHLHHTALQQRAADLQRERDARDALAVAAERARISRELHDILAHGLSVMVIQTQGAAAALHRQPERAAQALASTIDTGRACLAEMRRLLGAVRGQPDAAAPLAPSPGIGALAALVDQTRTAGTPVSLHVQGNARPVPSGVDLAAYRIVQESLTNTRKHAGAGASARVQLSFRPDHLEIEIADDGPGCPPPEPAHDTFGTAGNGLRGIAERVSALGGTVEFTGPPGGGFSVRAQLPIGETA
ncbi:sensor histidine kinase [Dactylosporangium sp. NPDC005572]|uniref:sensor histidine kinase n=1 Tax=Dactylosporangium sp. NPDC005572 TaxID=3156889 RepID=UPI0033BD969A